MSTQHFIIDFNVLTADGEFGANQLYDLVLEYSKSRDILLNMLVREMEPAEPSVEHVPCGTQTDPTVPDKPAKVVGLPERLGLIPLAPIVLTPEPMPEIKAPEPVQEVKVPESVQETKTPETSSSPRWTPTDSQYVHMFVNECLIKTDKDTDTIQKSILNTQCCKFIKSKTEFKNKQRELCKIFETLFKAKKITGRKAECYTGIKFKDSSIDVIAPKKTK